MDSLLSLSWLWCLLLAVLAVEQLGWRLMLRAMAVKEQRDQMMESLNQTLATLQEAKQIGQQIDSLRASRAQQPSTQPTVH